jgi:hypothetical protein
MTPPQLFSHQLYEEDSSMPLQESDYLKGANDEYVGRLHARNRIILNFITVSGALIGVAAAEQTGRFAFVAVGVGFFSLATASLNQHHELMMGHLIAYQRKLIEITNPKPLSEGWHDFRKEQVETARRHRDTAVWWMHVLFCGAALGIALVRELSSPEKDPGWLHIVKLVLFSFSLWFAFKSIKVVVRTQEHRNRISQLTNQEQCEVESILLQIYPFVKSEKTVLKGSEDR